MVAARQIDAPPSRDKPRGLQQHTGTVRPPRGRVLGSGVAYETHRARAHLWRNQGKKDPLCLGEPQMLSGSRIHDGMSR